VPVSAPGGDVEPPEVPAAGAGAVLHAPEAVALAELPDVPEPDWPVAIRLKEWLGGRAGQVFPGTRVLIVDDDIRNVFALTHVLGRVGMSVLYAENGREGVEELEKHPDISLVLMDIMMPELDGYETIHKIRGTPRFADLPIIALTAKAMPGDREKAIGSGASDYIPKPVDVDRLLSAALGLLDQAAEQGPAEHGPAQPAAADPEPPGAR
jgi:CheY-like chemotaxis protein